MYCKVSYKNHLLYTIIVLLCSFYTASLFAEQKKGPFKGYGAYFPQIKLLCQAVIEDGRGEYVSKTAIAFSDRDPGCEACRPLMQAIAQNCKAPIAKKTPLPKVTAVEEDPSAPVPTPTVVPIQNHSREPSTLVIQRALTLFSKVAEDDLINVQSKQALSRLFFVLTDASRSTEAEHDYFDTLQAFVMPLFETEELTKQAKVASEEEVSPKVKDQHLNSLFDQ